MDPHVKSVDEILTSLYYQNEPNIYYKYQYLGRYLDYNQRYYIFTILISNFYLEFI